MIELLVVELRFIGFIEFVVHDVAGVAIEELLLAMVRLMMMQVVVECVMLLRMASMIMLRSMSEV